VGLSVGAMKEVMGLFFCSFLIEGLLEDVLIRRTSERTESRMAQGECWRGIVVVGWLFT